MNENKIKFHFVKATTPQAKAKGYSDTEESRVCIINMTCGRLMLYRFNGNKKDDGGCFIANTIEELCSHFSGIDYLKSIQA